MQKPKKNLARNVIWFCKKKHLNVDVTHTGMEAHYVLPTRRELHGGFMPDCIKNLLS